jgi:hypothetical protein
MEMMEGSEVISGSTKMGGLLKTIEPIETKIKETFILKNLNLSRGCFSSLIHKSSTLAQ